ncbi:MAG: hypothetical protein K8R92_06525 [Planctomycetes bacterium]|nr:hypothetical protein [Planctomycetota bacterium]
MRGWIPDALLALVSAVVVSLCIAAWCVNEWCVNILFGTHLVDIDTWVVNGRDPWTVSHHEGFGVDWVNCSKIYAPLLSPVEAAGAPPSWAVNAMAPMDQYERGTRVAALGAGWPMVQVVRVWVQTRNDELFPPSAEFDVSGACLDMGRNRLWEEPRTFSFVPVAVVVDVIPWFAMFFVSLRLYRGHGPQRPALRTKAAAGSPPAAAP